ncbi:hypothetical protein FJV41_46205 [Myxococcus llanfairpwllgwyngyllgogerychwyrndrobwllllantysiliogogogochensis]|uniref:Lipoprotein n=1 Tax=Myxococcus llanfairpwllgwyngyllgogerychwyrndrobwllllantysiliogogogochensis TaxID=2590453 RepID=A0A540WJE1_9BACT|nr:hypothetical protein [Myxococcus llanfairpwllgwyngyllgogerychwyrndrobwllllantysiliogogogochensis]TQF09139.1 hypothetical protein FJV41_46205 [Myxococcus llanfairpwllgwyngyllgogerychwyrndrobwllllantysiliogogogochensis]
MQLPRFSVVLVSACAAWLVGCGDAPADSMELADGLSTIDPRSGPTGDGTWMGEPTGAGCEPDAGTPPPTDGGPSADTVLVTSTTRFFTSVGISEQVEDLSANPPEILVPQGATFSLILGSAVPGGWEFRGVPQGPYYLHTGTTHVITSARHVDVGRNRLGREDAIYSEFNWAPLQINLLNLAPWTPSGSGNLQPGSSLQLTSGQVDLFGWMDLFERVPGGQTSILTNQASLSLGSGYNIPIFEAARGDRMYVNQLSQFSAQALSDGTPVGYAAVERSLEVGAFDFAPDGVNPLPVSGMLQPVRMREFPVEWRLPAFTRFASEVHPLAAPWTPTLQVLPAAHGLSEGWIGYSGELLTLRLPRASSFDYTTRLKFGNPFPQNWGVVGASGYSFRHSVLLPDGSGKSLAISGTISTVDTLDNLIAGPLQPRVSPPRSLTIDGVPASVPREVGSVSPVIAWAPPTLGTPNAYRVAFYRYDPDLNFAFQTASLYVPGSATQVRLPPDVLQPDSIYYLRVGAIDAPGFDMERHPFTTHEQVPYSSADAVSSLITTP